MEENPEKEVSPKKCLMLRHDLNTFIDKMQNHHHYHHQLERPSYLCLHSHQPGTRSKEASCAWYGHSPEELKELGTGVPE